MPLSSKDLPPRMKEELLSQLREQIFALVPSGADAEWAWWHYVLMAPVFILTALCILGDALGAILGYFDWLAKDPAAGCGITTLVVIGVAVVVLVLVLIF